MSKHNTKHWVDDYDENYDDEQYNYGPEYDHEDDNPVELTEEQ